MGTVDMRSATPLELAIQLHHAGDFSAALTHYDQAVALDPDNADAWCGRGNILAALRQPEAALESYQRAIALGPESADPHDFRGVVLAQCGRMDEALASLDRAVALEPGNLNALSNRANVLKSLNRVEEALAILDRIVEERPDFAPGHNNRGNVLIALGRFEEAVASFDRAIALDPTQLPSLLNRAHALVKASRHEEAIESYRRALALDPRHLDALLNLAEIFTALSQHEQAALCYERALELEPNDVEGCIGLGDALFALSRPDLAIVRYQRALSLDPGNADAVSHTAIALAELGHRQEARTWFDRAIAVAPNDPQTWQRRGVLLQEVGDLEGAFESHDQALRIAPALPCQAGQRLQIAMRMARWESFDRSCADLRRSVVAGEQRVAPFDFVSVIDSPELQRRCAELFLQHELPNVRETPIERKYPRHQRIRIGYYSSDFRDHATMRLFLETLEAHDRDRFELIAISFGPDAGDQWHSRTKAAVDRFFDVKARSDREIVQLSRELEIDIGVDLKGYTQANRTSAFLHRVAPVQVSYLGYPGTLGMPAMDYLLADHVVVPEGSEQHYSEKILYLPDCYQPNARIVERTQSTDRGKEGLPQDGFVYCCFNQSYKITPYSFTVWMNILCQVEGSVLWLWVNDEITRSNFRAHAVEQGVTQSRLIFAARKPQEEHLDRLSLADLFLDTLPYNAHTTASDALRAGVPVLTCPGQSFASRVAASILTAIGVPELIAANLAEYEEIAIALGTDPGRHARILEKVARNRTVTTLFDPVRKARNLEDAFKLIYERYQSDLPPDHAHL